MPGALLFAAEVILLILVGADLARDLTLLSPVQRLLVAGAAIALLLAGAVLRRLRPGSVSLRSAPAALGIAVAIAATLVSAEEIGSARMIRGWDAGATDRVQARADQLQGDFEWLLTEIARPFETRIADSDDPRAAFAILKRSQERTLLPADRYGLALYRADGRIVAWAGNSSSAPASLLAAAGPGPLFAIGGNEETPRLYAMAVDGLTGLRRIAELVLRSPGMVDPGSDPEGAHLAFLPHWNSIEPAVIRVLPAPGAAGDAGTTFGFPGDRHWFHPGRARAPSLSVPLRPSAGDALLSADLVDRPASQEQAARRAVATRIAAVLLVIGLLLATALIVRAAVRPAWARLLLASASVWGLRLLLLLGSADAPRGSALFDFSVYASSDLGGLLRSPADLVITCCCFLAQAWLLRRFIDGLALHSDPGRRGPSRLAAAVAATLATAASVLWLHSFIDHLVLESRIDVSRVTIDPNVLPRLALQASLFLAVAACGLVVIGLVRLARRKTTAAPPPGAGAGAPPGVLPFLARGAAFVVVLTALYVPFLLHSYARLRRDFFENDLMQLVLYQHEERREILRDTLRAAGRDEFALAAASDEDLTSPGSLAYRLWTQTPLASEGLASSLRVYDGNGHLVSRFAVNLGIMFEPQFWQVRDAADGDLVTVPPQAGVTLRTPIVCGSRWVRPPGQPPRLVAFTVVDDYDNVPLLGAESSYLPLLRARALSRTNPELLRFEPLMAVFSQGLDRLYESGGEIPVPPLRISGGVRRGDRVWTRDDVGEGPARILYFQGPAEIFALAQPESTLTRALAIFLRLALLNGALFLAAVLLARAAAAIAGQAFPPLLPGRSFYARLTAVFLLGAVAPLLSLSMFVSRFSARESQRELVAAGLASLQTVRRVADDYLNLPDPGYGPDLDEEVVFWLSRVVRQDINFYRGADLIASSTPELFLSSLLNTRLDGDVYRALYVDREPFQLARAQVGDLDYLTLSAPARIDREGTMGVVSIPLALQSRALARKAEELADAIMIASCLTVGLLALFGWLVARRVSNPIISLAGAARRVAAGDFDVRVGPGPRDEIGVLVEAFNRMAESLQQQRRDLSRRREYIETILTRATTGVLSLDAAGEIITINPAAQQLLAPRGAPPQPGDELPEWLAALTDLAPLRRALERALDDRLEGEVSLDLGAGAESRRVRAVFLPFTPEQGRRPGRIVMLEDVTDIIRSGRLSAWAEMARRIAHEVKNPLTPIQLSVEHVRRVWRAGDARFGSVLEECLDNIQGQVRALREIAGEFSAYARIPEIRREAIQVADLLDSALGAYMAAPPPGIFIIQEVPSGLPALSADRAVIARVLVNLIENAMQAMHSGGRIVVSAAADAGPPSRVRIVVRDTGTGIAPEVLARIFEPYFSTKSGGTGLGLAIARRAVEEHGGTIDIRSRPGEGTVVTLALPAAHP